MRRERSDALLWLSASGPVPAGAVSCLRSIVRRFGAPSFVVPRPPAVLIPLVLCLCLLVSAGCSLPKDHGGKAGARASGAAICKTALSTVGTRYTYGGATPAKGFDCSGLVSWTYAKHGVAVPRTAREQSAMGRAVSKGNLRPGDLVVFKTRSGLHTGIYTGKGRFVHSPRSGTTVREEAIDSKYWRGRFVAGRRHFDVY